MYYHDKAQILHKTLVKKRYFDNNLLKFNIKLYDIVNFFEKLNSK